MNIKDIEDYVDQVWETLAICRLPLHLALFTALSVYEINNAGIRDIVSSGKSDRRVADGGIVHLREGLQTLIPLLFEKCPSIGLKKNHIKALRNLRTIPLPAIEASNFSQRYGWFAYHMTAHYQHWLDCSVDGRILTFSNPENVDIGNSLMHHALKRFHEELYTDKSSLSQAFIGMSYKERAEKLRISLRHKSIGQYLYSIPSDVLNQTKKMVESSAPRPTIQEDLVFETYSIGEYYSFWKHLSALMLCYLEVCNVKYDRSNRLTYSRVLILTPDEIIGVVSSSGEVSADACSDIVRDFTLDIYSQRPDIQVRYIVPIKGSDYVYLSPTLVLTSYWEVCLLRNWGMMSHEKYGAVIASKKSILANQFAEHFVGDGVVTVIKKNIYINESGFSGEVDLVVLDKYSGYLAVVELKWLLTPDSFQEESHAREEMRKGIDQLEQIIIQCEQYQDLFLEQLFSSQHIEPGMVTQVQYFLICDGDIYKNDKADHLGINVLDYQLCVDTLARNAGDSTQERFGKAIDRNIAYAQTSARDLCYHTMKIAGYAFRTPGLKMSGKQDVQESHMREPYSPKSPCFCGSGRVYRDCCQLVESIEEKPTEYL